MKILDSKTVVAYKEPTLLDKPLNKTDRKYHPIILNNKKSQHELSKIKETYDQKPEMLTKLVEEFVDRFGIPTTWIESIKYYVRSGKLKYPSLSNTRIHCGLDLEKNKTKLYLEIYPYTTLKDIGRSWKQIKKIQKTIVRPKLKDITPEDMKILKLLDEGWTYSDILQKTDLYLQSEEGLRKHVQRIRKVLSVQTKAKRTKK